MLAHQQRVVAEKDALDVKRIALDGFITGNPAFGNLEFTEKEDLRAQLNAMNQYSQVLGRRIARFEPSTAVGSNAGDLMTAALATADTNDAALDVEQSATTQAQSLAQQPSEAPEASNAALGTPL